MRRRWVRAVIGVAGSALALALVAAAAYRSYGPGDAAARLANLQQRWRPFYDPIGETTAPQIWRFIGGGVLLTLEAAVIAVLLSLLLGIGLALLRLSRNRQVGIPAGPAARAAVATPASVVVQSIRSLPLFLLILYTFIAAPKLGLQLPAMAAGIVALTVYTSCVLAEIVRAGILSLDRGQFEAADALGLRYLQKLRYVVLPQALRRMVPAVVSQLVTLIKDTSLLSNITVTELMRRMIILSQAYFNPIECYLVAGSIYFVINLSLSSLARRLEVRPTAKAAAGVPTVQGVGSEDQTLIATAAPTSR
ncbi:MAG: amino acid ABC transporter permease [Actinomycetota bacterium]